MAVLIVKALQAEAAAAAAVFRLRGGTTYFQDTVVTI